MTRDKFAAAILLGMSTLAFCQVKVAAPLPDTPVATGPVKAKTEALFSGYVGVAHGKNGYAPIGSINYRLTEKYGLFVAKSSIAYSGGVTFSFGHKK